MSYTILPNGRISPKGWVTGISPVSLFHAERCEHDNVDKQPADPSVGYMSGYVQCEDCGEDVTDMYDNADEWDDGDRAYDSWKDSQFDRD